MLLAIRMAQEQRNFVHYDLHSSNIIMEKTLPNMISLYVLKDEVP